VNKKEIIEQLKNKVSKNLLCKADKARQDYVGNKIHIRGIIEFSNYCCRSCLYCGLRRENKSITRYRMLPAEIIRLSNKIIQSNIKTIILQSGDDFGFSRKTLCKIIGRIKKTNPEIAITLCIGERQFDDYKAFKDVGADRYLLKHETANSALYKRLHPRQVLKTRLQILEYLKKLGYQIGAGNIVGLPGQTIEDLTDDILLLKDLAVEMAGIGPFIPQRDTPVANFPKGNLDLTLKVIALTRIITKNIHLPATTALAALNSENGQFLGLEAGCNVLMPDFTPEYCRQNYVIYDNKPRIDLKRAEQLISKAKRIISKDRGDTLKCKERQRACVYT